MKTRILASSAYLIGSVTAIGAPLNQTPPQNLTVVGERGEPINPFSNTPETPVPVWGETKAQPKQGEATKQVEPATEATPKAKQPPKPKAAPKPKSDTPSDPLPQSLGVGKARGNNELRIDRLDDDEPEFKNQKSRFIKGSKVENDVSKEETIRYAYVSRGAWLVRAFQPFLDSIAVEVAKSQNKEVFVDFTESMRTFAYLCVLIASDDGSKQMLRAIAKAISVHRQAVSTLSINWTGKDETVKKLIAQYIEVTYLRGVDETGVRIPAGELAKSEYISAQDALNEAKEGDGKKIKGLDGLLPKFNQP